MPIKKSIFGPTWGPRIARAGLKLAKMAGYDAGQPSRTFAQHTRLGSNPNSVNSQIERVRMEWNAEYLAKNSAFGIGYIRQRLNYCSPQGWMPNTGDAHLNGELRAYIDEWMEDGGMNCSAYDSFARTANVQLPTRGDSALVWMRDESRLRINEAGGDQIGELNIYGNPTFISELGLTYFQGMYFDRFGVRQAFRIYSKGTNDYYFTPEEFPASDVLYFSDNLFGGVRGVTIFHGTIKTLSKSDQLFQFGMDAAQKQAKTGVVVRNEQGGPMGELSYDAEITDDGNVVYIERTFEGAQTQYQYTGDSYEVIKTDAPGDALIAGCEYADERSCLSLGMPFSFLVNARDVGGAPSRLEISKAGKEVERLRKVQSLNFARLIYVIVMDAVDRKIFKGRTIERFTSKQLTNGTPKFPNLPTADAFRETQDDIASNRAGLETRAGILAKTNEDWPTVLNTNTQEAMDISMKVQDANRILAKRISPVDNMPYEGDITAVDVAQNSDNPQQSATAEAMIAGANQIAPGIPSSGKNQTTDNPPNVTRGVFSEFDEAKHPRKDNGEFGEGSDDDDLKSNLAKTITKGDSSVKTISNDSDEADDVEEIFKQSGISVSGIREPLFALKQDGKVIGGIMADKDGDMKVDIAVHEDHRGEGVGRRLLERSVRYYAKNRVKLAEESGVAPEDYSLIVLPVSPKMRPLLESMGFQKDGEEFTITHERLSEIEDKKASMSAYIGDILARDLPESTQVDIANILGTNGTTGKLKLIKYGMVPQELEKMADAHNLESAQKHIRNMPNYVCSADVHGDQEKHVLIQNHKVIDGHHFLAKALKGGVTKSLPVIDLTPSRFQGAALKDWDESKHPRAEDGEFGNGGGVKKSPKLPEGAHTHYPRTGGTIEMRDATPEERKKIAIPPAYGTAKVPIESGGPILWKAQAPNGKIQLRRSDTQAGKQLQAKHERGSMFSAELPQIKAKWEKDLNSKDEAKVLRLVHQTGFRNGGEGGGGKAPAYGASSLRSEHVTVDGDKIHFVFPGKGGHIQDHELIDPILAKHFQERKASGADKMFDTNDSKTREYLHSIDGDFIVHDFRTHAATRTAAAEVERQLKANPPKNAKDAKEIEKAALVLAARKIGDTVSVAKGSYVNPQVFEQLHAIK